MSSEGSDGVESATVSVVQDRMVVLRRRSWLMAQMLVPLVGTVVFLGVRISARGSAPGFVWGLGVMAALVVLFLVVWWPRYRRAMGEVGQPGVRLQSSWRGVASFSVDNDPPAGVTESVLSSGSMPAVLVSRGADRVVVWPRVTGRRADFALTLRPDVKVTVFVSGGRVGEVEFSAAGAVPMKVAAYGKCPREWA